MIQSRILKFILQAVSTAILSSIQFLDLTYCNSIQQIWLRSILSFFFDYRLQTAFILGVIIVLVGFTENLHAQPKYTRDLRQRIMKQILKELFENNYESTRITLFRKATWYKNLWYNIKDLFKRPKLIRDTNITWHYKKYITVWERLGDYSTSHTYFAYSPHTSAKCEGIAGYVMYKGEKIVINNLPDITSVKIKDLDFAKKNTQVIKNVKEYMLKGRINDIITLDRLHQRARHFLGDVLYKGDSGKPCGIIVIDSIEPISPFSDPVQDKIKIYLPILNATF